MTYLTLEIKLLRHDSDGVVVDAAKQDTKFVNVELEALRHPKDAANAVAWYAAGVAKSLYEKLAEKA